MSDIVKSWEQEGFVLEVELMEGEFLLHCDVDDNSVGAARACKRFIHEVCIPWLSERTDVVYTYTRNPRFVSFVNKDAELIGSDNGLEVYAWELHC